MENNLETIGLTSSQKKGLLAHLKSEKFPKGYLGDPALEISKFIVEKISRAYDPNYLALSRKVPRVANYLNNTSIDFEKLGYKNGNYKIKKLKKEFYISFDISLSKNGLDKLPKLIVTEGDEDYIRTLGFSTFTEILIECLEEDELVELKKMFDDYFELYIEKEYLFMMKESENGGFLASCDTWGDVFDINPKWFDILCEIFQDEVSAKITENGLGDRLYSMRDFLKI